MTSYFGVVVGRTVGVFGSLKNCMRLVDKFKDSKYQEFSNIESAVKYVTGSTHPAKLVFVDGSYRDINGCKSCGIGIYYGSKDGRNLSISLKMEDTSQTSMRMELLAICRALKNVQRDSLTSKYCILSDSASSIHAITVSAPSWAIRGWCSNRKKPIPNMHLIRECYGYYEFINKKYQKNGWGKLDIVYVQSHCGIEGNKEADSLACLAAKSNPI